MEKNSWPTYLKIFAPSWLESINYPFSGVGDLTDLKFYAGVGNNGQWLGFLNPGWFYHDNKEQYNFITKGETLVAAVSGSTLSQLTSGYSITFAGSGTVTNSISYRPSWGPVLVTSANTASSFVNVYNFTVVASSESWKPTGILIYPKQSFRVTVTGSLSGTVIFVNGGLASSYQYAFPEGAYYDNVKIPSHTYNPSGVAQWGTDVNVPTQYQYSPNTPPFSVSMAMVGTNASTPGIGWQQGLRPNRDTIFDYSAYTAATSGRCPWELYFIFNDVASGWPHSPNTPPFSDNLGYFNVTVEVFPPIITRPNNAHQYTQHHNCFSPGHSLSWTSLDGSIYYASLPASSLLVGLRDLTTLPMGSVSSSGLIINNKLYYYDYYNQKVYAKPDDTSNINFYADLVYQKPCLRFREIVVLEDSGLLPSYRNIENIDIVRGNQSYNYCYSVSGYLTNPVTGIANGDWVILEYNISKSYVLIDHKTLQYYIGYSKNPLGDNFIINYETSIPDTLPSISLASPTSLFNLNPIFKDAYRAGYLHHALPVSGYTSYWTYKKLLIGADKLETCSDWNETFTVSVTLLDKNNLPLPQYPVTLTYTPLTTSLFIYPVPTSTTSTSALITKTLTTDNRGEINATLQNIGYGKASITAFAGTLSGNVCINSYPASSFININKFLGGQVNLVLTKNSTARSSILGAVSTNDLDGIPSFGSISLYSKYSSEFNDLNSPPIIGTGSLSLNTSINTFNIGGIKRFGYTPQPNDKLLGISTNGQSDIL